MRRFSHHEMLGLYLIHLSATLTDVLTLCAQHLWMPFPENSPSQTFCWCLEHFLPEACCPHQQGCMEKVVTFLLIRSLGVFFIMEDYFVHFLSSAGVTAGIPSFGHSLQTTFSQTPLFMLLWAQIPENKRFSWALLEWEGLPYLWDRPCWCLQQQPTFWTLCISVLYFSFS